jgi:hypothetical protein
MTKGKKEMAIVNLTGIPEDELSRPDWGYGKSNKLMHEVLPDLWQGGTHDDDTLGNERFARKPFITKANFDAVVTMYQYANPVGWFVKEMRYCIYDAQMDTIDLDELFTTARWAYNEWAEGKRVLIRCQAGWNRSGLITALVLMLDGIPATEAIDIIRHQRSENALCNPAFVEFLENLDLDLLRGKVTQIASVKPKAKPKAEPKAKAKPKAQPKAKPVAKKK